jgi:hypothetical protein
MIPSYATAQIHGRTLNCEKLLVAGRDYSAGEPVLELRYVRWRNSPRNDYLWHPSGHYFYDPLLANVATSDDPNCRFSFDFMVLIARRDIPTGELITADVTTDKTCGTVTSRRASVVRIAR